MKYRDFNISESLVSQTTANELVFGQHAVLVDVHSLEDFLRPYGRHLAVFSRLVVRHQVDRLDNNTLTMASRLLLPLANHSGYVDTPCQRTNSEQ